MVVLLLRQHWWVVVALSFGSAGILFPTESKITPWSCGKNSLYETTSPTSSYLIKWWNTPLSSLWEIHCRIYTFRFRFRGLSSSTPCKRPKQRAASDIFRQRKSWAAAIFVYTRLTNHRHRIPLICNNMFCCATSGNTRNRNLAIICHTTEQVRVWVYSLFDVTNFFACMFTKT